jgi:hypothetical protein
MLHVISTKLDPYIHPVRDFRRWKRDRRQFWLDWQAYEDAWTQYERDLDQWTKEWADWIQKGGAVRLAPGKDITVELDSGRAGTSSTYMHMFVSDMRMEQRSMGPGNWCGHELRMNVSLVGVSSMMIP